MADQGSSGAAASTSIDLQDENSITLQDVLDEEKQLEDDADAVLGGSDDKNCTYEQGYVKRQALYACKTCIGADAEPAGVCLACSYACHEGHDLYELYTKRNFRCDCGNGSFPSSNPCRLCPKDARNVENKYNQNFHGRYCTCKRPYPDPDDDVEDEMLQCIMCEDWYHGRHIGGDVPENHDYHEVICTGCMNKHTFLWQYFAHELSLWEKDKTLDEDNLEKSTTEDNSSATSPVEKNGVKEEVKAEDSTVGSSRASMSVNAGATSNGTAHPIKQDGAKGSGTTSVTDSDRNGDASCSWQVSRPAKREREEAENGLLWISDCVLRRLRSNGGGDVKEELRNECAYWPLGWRSRLCRCMQCLALYSEQRCLYLLDEEDTVQSYEDRGKAARAQAPPAGDPLMSALGTLGHVQQIEAIRGYNNLKTELVDFLKKFADTRKVVREEDVREFFSNMQARKRQKVSGVPYFCR
ncbi:putative E3 ubiquitin-protein ligase UBR7 isoform X2 [Haemaphysalis longicornis]